MHNVFPHRKNLKAHSDVVSPFKSSQAQAATYSSREAKGLGSVSMKLFQIPFLAART